MPLRRNETDPAREEAVTAARAALHDALATLEVEAGLAARAARSKRGNPDLPSVIAAFRMVERAEEALDLAVYDRDTAAGADG